MLRMESLHQPAHPDPHEGACILESVANLPDYRDGGLIGALVREILGEGRQRGFGLAQVSFLIGNTAAERAYQKAGFRIQNEKRPPTSKPYLAALAQYGCSGSSESRTQN